MPPDPSALRAIAHEALALARLPLQPYHPGAKHWRDGAVAFHANGTPGPGFNFAAVLGPAPPLAAILAAADAFFPGGRGSYGVLVEGDAGHPAEAELRGLGWVVAEDEPALVMPVLVPPPPPPPGFTVAPVRDEAGFHEHLALLADVFATQPEQVRQMMPQWRCVLDPAVALLVGSVGGRPVAGVTLLCTGPTVHVAGVAVRPAKRGRGLGGAITLAAVEEGRRRGCTAAALRTGPLSHPLYRRLGFVDVCRHRTYAPPA